MKWRRAWKNESFSQLLSLSSSQNVYQMFIKCCSQIHVTEMNYDKTIMNKNWKIINNNQKSRHYNVHNDCNLISE